MDVETASQGSPQSQEKQPGILYRLATAFKSWMSKEFHRTRRSSLTGVPLLLMLIAVTMTGYGLIMVLSASSVEQLAKGSSPFMQVSRQVVFALIGLALMGALSFIPVTWYRNKWVLNTGLGLAILMQLGVMIFGVEIGGNRNWLQFGSITIQPSETSKLILALWMAWVLTQQGNITSATRKALFPLLFGFIPLVGLILGGHDVGTVLVYVAMLIGVLWFAGINYKVLLTGILLAIVGGLLAVLISPNRLARVLGMFGHCQDSTCDQSVSGLAALATGGFWGVGLGRSRQKYNYLPEAHNDYIFAVIGEELGLLGTLLIIVLYLGLIYCIIRIILRSADRFIAFASGTVLVWISGQALINMAMVTGMLPVIGIPLPFISYGGSSLISTLAAVGILIAFARQTPLQPIMEDGATVYYAGETGKEKARRSRLGTVVEQENRQLDEAGENAGFDIALWLKNLGIQPVSLSLPKKTAKTTSAPQKEEPSRSHHRKVQKRKSTVPSATPKKPADEPRSQETARSVKVPDTQDLPEHKLPPGLVPLKKIRQKSRDKDNPGQP